MTRIKSELLRRELIKRLRSRALPAMRLYGRLTGQLWRGAQWAAKILRRKQTPPDGSNSLNIVRQIKDLPLPDFIACAVHAQYSVLGNGTLQQLEGAWHSLLSQYYEKREDANLKGQMKLRADMLMLQFRAKWIACSFTVLQTRYTESVAAELRILGRPFTQDTYIADMKYIGNREKMNELKYLNLKKEFEQQEKNARPGAGKNTEDAYYESVMAYNEAFKTSGSVANLNTLEYALMTKRLDSHYRILKDKNRANNAR